MVVLGILGAVVLILVLNLKGWNASGPKPAREAVSPTGSGPGPEPARLAAAPDQEGFVLPEQEVAGRRQGDDEQEDARRQDSSARFGRHAAPMSWCVTTGCHLNRPAA